MTLTTAHQYGAGLCFRAESGKLDAATTRFCKLVQEAGFKLPSNPKKYVQEWGPRLGDDGTIESHAQESGRISTLAVEAVLTCHTEALGWWRAGMDQPYGSIQELVETNPVVKSIITQAGVTKDTLLRHMKDVFPNFQFKKLYPKRKLTAAGMADRVSACQQNQQVSDRDLELVVWLDQKTYCFNRKHRYGWIDTDAEDYYESTTPRRYGKKAMTFKYYIAVNALLGFVWMDFYTGTSDLPAKRGRYHFKVSSCTE
jgi:hypothetical protein